MAVTITGTDAHYGCANPMFRLQNGLVFFVSYGYPAYFNSTCRIYKSDSSDPTSFSIDYSFPSSTPYYNVTPIVTGPNSFILFFANVGAKSTSMSIIRYDNGVYSSVQNLFNYNNFSNVGSSNGLLYAILPFSNEGIIGVYYVDKFSIMGAAYTAVRYFTYNLTTNTATTPVTTLGGDTQHHNVFDAKGIDNLVVAGGGLAAIVLAESGASYDSSWIRTGSPARMIAKGNASSLTFSDMTIDFTAMSLIATNLSGNYIVASRRFDVVFYQQGGQTDIVPASSETVPTELVYSTNLWAITAAGKFYNGFLYFLVTRASDNRLILIRYNQSTLAHDPSYLFDTGLTTVTDSTPNHSARSYSVFDAKVNLSRGFYYYDKNGTRHGSLEENNPYFDFLFHPSASQTIFESINLQQAQIYEESISVSHVNAISIIQSLLIDRSVSISSNHQISNLLQSVYNVNITLSSNHSVSSTLEVILNLVSSITSVNQISTVVNLIAEGAVSVSLNADTAYNAVLLMELLSTIDSDSQLTATAGLLYDLNVLLSTNNQAVASAQLLLETIIALSSLNGVSVTASLVMDLQSAVSSINDLSSQVNLIAEVSSSLDSSGVISPAGGVLFDLLSSISSDNQLSSSGNITAELVATFVSNHDMVSSGVVTLEEAVSFISEHLLECASNLIAENQSDISSDHQQDSNSNIIISPSGSLDASSDLSSVASILIDLASSIQSNGELTADGQLLVSLLSSVSGDSVVQTSGSLIVDGNASVSAGADTDPFPASSLVGAINLVSQHLLSVLEESGLEYNALLSALNQLQAQSEGVLENLILISSVNDLQALAQIVQELSSSVDASSQLTASILSDFIEQVSIDSSASISTNLVLEYLNFIGINADSDISTAIQSEINQIISLLINSAISAVDELVQGGQTYEESISIQSIALLLVNSQVPSHTLTLIGVSVIKFISKLK